MAFRHSHSGTQSGIPGQKTLTDRELGIFGMLTAPGHRGRGVGAEILNSLLTWGRRAGATVAYLQVERDNLPAVRLYSGAGFVPVYDYDYWTLDARGGDSSRGEVSDGLPLVVPEWQ